MNAKRAKAYRMVVKQMITRGVLQEPWAVYGTNRTTGSTMLSPMCPKGVYKRLKRNGLQNVLTGTG
jgi:hypothetical protein